MKREQKFAVWETNAYDNEIRKELTAHFYHIEAAKDFVDYQASIGRSFVVVENNGKIYPEE